MPRSSNHSYLKALIDNIPDMAWLKDAEGRFILVNPAMAQGCGREISEIIGKTDRDIWPREAAERYVAADREVMLSGQRRTIVESFVDPRGETRWIETIKTPILNGDGGAIGTAGIARDITERKHAEEALADLSNEFITLLENTTDLIYFKDAKSRFRFCSQSLARISGMPDWRDLIDKSDQDLFPEELARKYVEDEQRIFRQGKPLLDIIEPFVDASGKEIWLHTNKWPIFSDDKKKVSGIFGISRDITERKRAEEQIRVLLDELNQNAANLQAANQELETFSYSLTHDLRKPLSVINGYCQMILVFFGQRLDEECREYLGQIHKETLRMNRQIDAVLQLSRVTRGELHRETIDLSAMAEQVASDLQLSGKGRKVIVSVPPGLKVHADPDLLLMVMENLLGNAWKYTGQREQGLIEVGAFRDDGGTPTFFVRDNGIGFAMSEADKLFLPFKRLNGAESFSGEGIGLATVERIIKRHGGMIWAEGEPDRGATFYFQLQPGEHHQSTEGQEAP